MCVIQLSWGGIDMVTTTEILQEKMHANLPENLHADLPRKMRRQTGQPGQPRQAGQPVKNY
jgi:hypothetical protein